MPLIYCVEDDESIRELVSYAMRGQGYKVEGFGDSGEFYEAVQKDVPDLILLDIMLPGEDGLSILKKIRSAGPLQNVPVIMMTAKTTEFDIVQGLDIGADDYVTKPFSIIELVARIKANIRRATKYINVSHEEEIIQIKDLKIYTDQHKVERGGKIINLTHTEFEILVLLASNPGRAFSKEEMYLKIWNEPYYGNERVLNSHMNRLRGKLNIDNSKLHFLQTKEYDNENDNSNVIYTKLDGYKFMFMGDAGIGKEKEILEKYNLSNIDVLKVGHHGNKTSSGSTFINKINPKYSIISVGMNNRLWTS